MDKEELLRRVFELLRKSILNRLNIPKADWEDSSDVQEKVAEHLANIIALAHNGTVDATAKAILENCPTRNDIDEITAQEFKIRLRDVKRTFANEISAFSKVEKMNQAGSTQEEIWLVIRSSMLYYLDGDDEESFMRRMTDFRRAKAKDAKN
jgi:hypothetical protein